ncbi:unnamed protein product [Caenorhabditis auriculariae]|uniref:Uncharacterized protein n=1 Tax=Caenorhabditis auriculariae TaxID=2777116 RepID=A0A8S1H5W3_9PELO|nr:unnamed protein product [Caenorhabditis auriculariae]
MQRAAAPTRNTGENSKPLHESKDAQEKLKKSRTRFEKPAGRYIRKGQEKLKSSSPNVNGSAAAAENAKEMAAAAGRGEAVASSAASLSLMAPTLAGAGPALAGTGRERPRVRSAVADAIDGDADVALLVTIFANSCRACHRTVPTFMYSHEGTK